MIYTSYFAKLKKLPDGIVPISIAMKAPPQYTGLRYLKLAPQYHFFAEWKRTHDNAYYIEQFQKRVLAGLNANWTFDTLSFLAGEKEFALICYERPDSFCHRHLVADWFRENGYPCEEIRYT